MINNKTSSGFQTKRDHFVNKNTESDKFANISKSKPLQYQHHIHKAVVKKKQLARLDEKYAGFEEAPPRSGDVLCRPGVIFFSPIVERGPTCCLG